MCPISSGQVETVLTKRRSVMPKRYRPYEEPKVVCKSVGANETPIFVIQENSAEVEEDVKPSLLGSSVQEVTKAAKIDVSGTVAFVTILLHALKCSNCDKSACKKMTMVLRHYKTCAFKRNLYSETATVNKNCKICNQLLRIVGNHAKHLCKLPPNQVGCPVLMCDAFRMANVAAATKKELNLSCKQSRVGIRRNGVTQPV